MATGAKDKIEGLVDDVLRDHRKLKRVISFLYDADMRNRLLGALTIGEIAKKSPEIIKKRWNRIFYAFDDTMSCWGAAEALGEIGRNIPEMRSKIVLFLRKFGNDEISCQGFIWAITRIGQVDREKIRNFIPDLIRFLDSKDACMVGQAIWSLGELEVSEIVDKIEAFSRDERQTWFYDNETARLAKVLEIARESIAKIRS